MEAYNAMSTEAKFNRNMRKLDKEIQQLKSSIKRYKKLNEFMDLIIKIGLVITTINVIVVFSV